MTEAQLHAKLMQSCQDGNVEGVKEWLNQGAEPNYNIKAPLNALYSAIEIDNHEIIALLLEHGAIVKDVVLQQAIEKNREYLHILISNFKACKDESLLISVLQAAMNINDFALAQQAVQQGAKPTSLFSYAIKDFGSKEIVQLLIENGFDIHAQNNILLSEWMGTCLIGDWRRKRPLRGDLLVFICDYYFQKPNSIEKFESLRTKDKAHIFRSGLLSDNITMMKFALMIGAEKNEALNSALYRYYQNKQVKMSYEIIEYILNSNMAFTKVTIANAVCFKYRDVLETLSEKDDLEYAYEMAYKYENSDLCDYFSNSGVSPESQNFSRMKISAIKGDTKELHKAINSGANLEKVDTEIIAEVIKENQVESLQSLYDAGLSLDSSLNKYLNEAMHQYKAYESISYLIELGLDITSVKNLPREYKNRYPAIADMREKRFSNIFDYTIYLVREVHPKSEAKEKEKVLQRIAELSSLPYVIKMSKEKSLEQ